MKQSPRNTDLAIWADQTYLFASETKRSVASLEVANAFDFAEVKLDSGTPGLKIMNVTIFLNFNFSIFFKSFVLLFFNLLSFYSLFIIRFIKSNV